MNNKKTVVFVSFIAIFIALLTTLVVCAARGYISVCDNYDGWSGKNAVRCYCNGLEITTYDDAWFGAVDGQHSTICIGVSEPFTCNKYDNGKKVHCE